MNESSAFLSQTSVPKQLDNAPLNLSIPLPLNLILDSGVSDDIQSIQGLPIFVALAVNAAPHRDAETPFPQLVPRVPVHVIAFTSLWYAWSDLCL